MSTVNEPESDALALRHGRSGPSWTEVHDWVALSEVSPTAAFLYSVLRMHVNRERGDDLVWTSTLALALIMGMRRGDKVKQYMDELVAIDAVSRDRGGLHRKNAYVVHKLPPDGWKLPTNIKDWHARNKPLLAVLRAEEKAKRDARRGRAKATKGQVNPVTPKQGEQAVTPKSGEQVHPKRGEPVTPKSGREPKEVELDEVEPTPPTRPASEPEPSAVAEASTSGGDDSNLDNPTRELLNALVEQVAADRGWEPKKIRTAIRAALDAKWPVDEVVSGLAEIADDRNTAGPGRLVSYLGVRHAKRAVQVAAADAEPTTLRVPGRDTPRCRVPGHETELAHNCVPCKTAVLVVDRDEAPVAPMDRQAAIAEAKAKAALGNRRGSDRRPVVRKGTEPTGLDQLNAVVSEMGAAAPVFADAV